MWPIWMRLSKQQRLEEIDAFSSKIIHGWTKTTALGKPHACNDAYPEGVCDGPCLPHGLNVHECLHQSDYWEQVSCSHGEIIWQPFQFLLPRVLQVTQVEAANAVPQVEVVPRTLEKLDEMQGTQQTRMLAEQRREVLFWQLDLSGMEGWSDKN